MTALDRRDDVPARARLHGAGAPLVTIVTPSFNQGRFIRATIESVLAQDYPHVEYLVLDGGSTDETARVVEPYRDRLTWVSEPDHGQGHAINKGFRRARGEIVAWLNSDDLLLPRAVSAAVEALEADPALAFVYGDAYVIDEHGFNQGSIRSGDPDPWKLANVADYIVQPSAFFRAWAIEGVGYLDESLHWCMDWDVFIRLSRRWPTRRIAEHLALARVYDTAKTQSGGLRRFREMRAIMRRYADRRFPPVFFLYACDAFSTIIGIWLRRSLGRLALDGSMIVAGLDAALLEPIRQGAARGGVYEDRWIGRKADLKVEGDGEALELAVSVPPVFGRLRPQRLALSLDGRELAKLMLPPGELTLAFPIGAGGEGHVSLRAARTFSGRREGFNQDARSLAVRLERVRRQSARDVAVWYAGGRYADGWVSPLLRLRLRALGRALHLRGRIPDLGCPGARQQLEVRCNGRAYTLVELEPGDFDLTLAVPVAEEFLELELRARRHVTLDERPGPPRRVAFRLEEIAWAGGPALDALAPRPIPAEAPLEKLGMRPGVARRLLPGRGRRAASRNGRAALLDKLARRADAGRLGILRWVLLHPARTLHPDFETLRRRREVRRRRVTTFWGERMTVHAPEDGSSSILRSGIFDPPLSALVIRALGPGRTFVDVGAHYGYFSLLAHRVMEGRGEVHAFEPLPSSFAVLAENVAGRKAIRAIRTAVWKDGSGAEIHDYGAVFSAYGSMYGLRVPALAGELPAPVVRRVPTVTLDDYCQANGVRPDVVKIDTEGAEMDVLEGMASFVLPELRPVVALEVGDMGVAAAAPSRKVVDRMLGHGYRAWEPRFGELVPHEPAAHYAAGNLVFTP